MQILDCTLRDGGYYTNWDFDSSIVNAYVSNLNDLPIHYIELGYRNKSKTEYMGEFAYCPIVTLRHIRSLTKKRLAIMLNEKDLCIEDLNLLLLPILGIVDMVRIAVDPVNLDRAIILAQKVKNMGFEVSFNMMYMSTWDTIDNFYKKIHQLNNVVDVFCMVDSFGSMTPQSVKDTIENVRMHTKCTLGFHGHNNLQLALINSLTALEQGVEIIDATMLGMGRGAGNLNVELLLTYLNKHHDLKVDFNRLGDTIQIFEPLREKYNWGTNLPYMLSGANSIPQKDVMEWVQNRIYSFNSIVRALDNRKSQMDDNAKYPVLDVGIKYQNILIVGGGETVVKHIAAILTFVKTYNVALVFATTRYANLFEHTDAPKYYCLLGNESKRFSSNVNFQKTFNNTCVLPPYPRMMGTDVPREVHNNTCELPQISFISKYEDSCTTLAVELAHLLNTDGGCIYVIGYDGYYNHMLSEKELTLNRENEEIFETYATWSKYRIVSLFPTIYKSLEIKSIYNLL